MDGSHHNGVANILFVIIGMHIAIILYAGCHNIVRMHNDINLYVCLVEVVTL